MTWRVKLFFVIGEWTWVMERSWNVPLKGRPRNLDFSSSKLNEFHTKYKFAQNWVHCEMLVYIAWHHDNILHQIAVLYVCPGWCNSSSLLNYQGKLHFSPEDTDRAGVIKLIKQKKINNLQFLLSSCSVSVSHLFLLATSQSADVLSLLAWSLSKLN